MQEEIGDIESQLDDQEVNKLYLLIYYLYAMYYKILEEIADIEKLFDDQEVI